MTSFDRQVTISVVHYRPQTKFAKAMFLQVSVCPHGGGRAWLLPGGAWLLGGVRGWSRGA